MAGSMASERTRPRPEAIEVVDEAMAQIYSAKTGAERLAIANGMFRSARTMLLSHLRTEHPTWSDQQIHEETARRLCRGAG